MVQPLNPLNNREFTLVLFVVPFELRFHALAASDAHPASSADTCDEIPAFAGCTHHGALLGGWCGSASGGPLASGLESPPGTGVVDLRNEVSAGNPRETRCRGSIDLFFVVYCNNFSRGSINLHKRPLPSLLQILDVCC